MQIILMILMIPSMLVIPVLIITAIVGASRKDYTYLKKYLKFWGYSLLALLGAIIFYGIITFIGKQ